MRNTLQGLKLKEKSEGDGKDKIEKAVQETLDWLEGVVNPITMKVYQAAGSLSSSIPSGLHPSPADYAVCTSGAPMGRIHNQEPRDLGVYFIVELFAQ